MRMPQVSERVKELPAQALRGVFAGIGQLLLITDKLMNKTSQGQQIPQARGRERPETVAETAKAAPAAETAKAAPTEKAPEARDLDTTGNVRLPGEAGAGAGGGTQPADAPVAAEAPVAEEARVAAPVAAEPPVAEEARVAAPVAAEPPVAEEAAVAAKAPVAAEAPAAEEAGAPLPNYDELSVASLRARLRNLDAAQVKQLAEYEKAHAGRADVIAMFERRIAKLEAGG